VLSNKAKEIILLNEVVYPVLNKFTVN